MHSIGIILLLSWLIFWYLFFRGKQSTDTAARPSRSFSLLTGAVFVAVGILHLIVFNTTVSNFSSIQVLAGFGILWAGQGLMLSARYALGFLSNKQVLFDISTRQVINGPYRYLHHPMYMGLLSALAATCFIFNSLWGFIFLLFCVLPLFATRAVVETPSRKG